MTFIVPPIPTGTGTFNLVPELQFTINGTAIGVSIEEDGEPAAVAYILQQGGPIPGAWYIVGTIELGANYPDGLLAAALTSINNPAGANNASADAWLLNTSYAIAAAQIQVWYRANILPKIQAALQAMYVQAVTPPPPVQESPLGLFDYMDGATKVDMSSGTILLTAAF